MYIHNNLRASLSCDFRALAHAGEIRSRRWALPARRAPNSWRIGGFFATGRILPAEGRAAISAARRETAREETAHQEGTGKPSLHSRILGEIEQRIFSGGWPPGHRIPSEHELTEQYGCSRMTVNKAMTELAQRGLIERRRKTGSFVLQPQVQSAVLEIHDIPREVQARGLTYHFNILGRRERSATAADRKRLGTDDAAEVMELTVLHYAGAQPFCFEERLVNLSAAPEAAEESFSERPPGSWLKDRVPWSAAEHRIRAVSADARLATTLKIRPGTACLVIERCTWTNGAVITQVHLTYPGELHELVSQFLPSARG